MYLGFGNDEEGKIEDDAKKDVNLLFFVNKKNYIVFLGNDLFIWIIYGISTGFAGRNYKC